MQRHSPLLVGAIAFCAASITTSLIVVVLTRPQPQSQPVECTEHVRTLYVPALAPFTPQVGPTCEGPNDIVRTGRETVTELGERIHILCVTDAVGVAWRVTRSDGPDRIPGTLDDTCTRLESVSCEPSWVPPEIPEPDLRKLVQPRKG